MIVSKNREQTIHRFDNGYGASVICNEFSYGVNQGLKELAVIKFYADNLDSWFLCYTTPITEDVIGYLKDEEVDALLAKIEALSKAD
jgi:hypothetical protein